MRELLFRGKCADKSMEWIYGDFVSPDGILTPVDNGKYSAPLHVIPETVGQFTGLIDTNGVKIFEGDILHYDYNCWTGDEPKTGIVRYGEYEQDGSGGEYKPAKCLGWYIEFAFSEMARCVSEEEKENSIMVYDDIKVIGNIHDNPELVISKMETTTNGN